MAGERVSEESLALKSAVVYEREDAFEKLFQVDRDRLRAATDGLSFNFKRMDLPKGRCQRPQSDDAGAGKSGNARIPEIDGEI